MPHYVIVGAGSAGCVLAARLSEDPAANVALVEAGPRDKAQGIHIPAAWPSLFKSGHDWDYDSEREPGLDHRRVYLPRGKMLGGSSSMNAMVYIRGARADYDGWARDGAKGWAYDDLLPYFRRSEANERDEDQFHGKLGPLTVSDGRSRYSLMDACGGGGRGGASPQSRLQRRQAGRRRLLSTHPARRHAVQRRPRFPASRSRPSELKGCNRCAHDKNSVRRGPGERR
jgi:choline dehydrogenase-like flavoprotein